MNFDMFDFEQLQIENQKLREQNNRLWEALTD